MSGYGESGRLPGVDVARGLALIGMMSVHIYPPFDPQGGGDLHLAYAVAAGRAAALFAVLAGVGLALLTGGPKPYSGLRLRSARAGIVARALLLFAVGWWLGSIESPPLVILCYYALLFLLGLPFLRLRAPALAALAVGWAVVAPVVSHLVRAQLGVETDVDEPGGADLLVELLLTGTYPALPWMTYLLAGLALGRLRLDSPRVAGLVALVGAGLALAAKGLSTLLLDAAGGARSLRLDAFGPADVTRFLDAGLFGVTPADDATWLVVSAPHSGTTLDLVHTTGTAMLVLGLALLATSKGVGVLLPLACAGSMTLTLYTLHVLAVADESPLLLTDRTTLYVVHVCAALALGTLWRLTVGRGPLEALSALLAKGAGGLAVARRLTRQR